MRLSITLASTGLCSNNSTTSGQSLLLITFGSGANEYSNKTPSSHNFSTTGHQQQYAIPANDGQFTFANKVPNMNNLWHTGALDHTPNDFRGSGYL